jgi:hypothetical protein
MIALIFLIAATPLPPLDFSTGKQDPWEGSGFHLAPGQARSLAGKTGLLHCTFRLPDNAAMLRFRAAAYRQAAADPKMPMDVVLEAPGRNYLPRLVHKEGKWVASEALDTPRREGELAEYLWKVDHLAGQRVRIILLDADSRPGSYLVCSGFELVTRDDVNATHFENDLRAVAEKHDLPPLRRYDSKHFLVYSNAEKRFTQGRIQDCERMHAAFFRHFRRKGFAVTPPAEKLMVAVFHTQQGFEAFLGLHPGAHVTGIYDTPTNRLLVYDFATNTHFLDTKRSLEEAAQKTPSEAERLGRSVLFARQLRDHRDDVNISTIMHEVSHQLCFNAGLLRRGRDTPAWLVEGLAMYCEPTTGGVWQGIGEANPMRSRVLKERKPFSLKDLVISDNWIRKTPLVEDVIAGYSQSWVLVRMLMQERPREMRKYLELIRERRAPEHRLADFAEAFGNFKTLEKRFQEYQDELANEEK